LGEERSGISGLILSSDLPLASVSARRRFFMASHHGAYAARLVSFIGNMNILKDE